MQTQQPSDRAAPTLFKIIFAIATILVMAAIAYAGWIMALYWGQVTV